ncbi:MAG: tRNA lysidine(34) synthetase TilS, partial [Octadecabacter sp.]|nr:tRNA lysidine(34) synthetase TilS [Octadecabacter sp.]
MGQLLGPEFPKHIALAVSGGGDSMTMLALAHGWARVMGVGLWVVTVDHGLRPQSAAEAAMVATECAALGHPHATLRWHWDGKGNVQDAARQARLALIDRWREGVEHVLFAHTQDDVAETLLMRLARGSGVEGLSAMAARRHVTPHKGGYAPVLEADVTQTAPPPPALGASEVGRGFHVIRPMLGMSRAELRHYADTLHVPYVDDPSNADPRFDRVKARQILTALAPLGLNAKGLAETAGRMRRA